MKLHKRKSYTGEDISDIKDPIKLFSAWYKRAERFSKSEPNAMSLATASRNGKPSIRELLMRGFSKDGFSFFTNTKSQKGKDLDENPFAAMQFYWPEIHKQIRISGKVKKLSSIMSDKYFASRPRGSQIAAFISAQSHKLQSRKKLLELYDKAVKQFNGKKIPRPNNWGGYILIPSIYEFWSGKENRLHDRVVYKKIGNKWKKFRVFP